MGIVTLVGPNRPRPATTEPVGRWLARRVERQLRRELAAWRIPLDDYGCVVERTSVGEGPFYDGGPIHYWPHPYIEATFTHRETGAQIAVTEIYYNERTGRILQWGTQYGQLTL